MQDRMSVCFLLQLTNAKTNVTRSDCFDKNNDMLKPVTNISFDIIFALWTLVSWMAGYMSTSRLNLTVLCGTLNRRPYLTPRDLFCYLFFRQLGDCRPSCPQIKPKSVFSFSHLSLVPDQCPIFRLSDINCVWVFSGYPWGHPQTLRCFDI